MKQPPECHIVSEWWSQNYTQVFVTPLPPNLLLIYSDCNKHFSHFVKIFLNLFLIGCINILPCKRSMTCLYIPNCWTYTFSNVLLVNECCNNLYKIFCLNCLLGGRVLLRLGSQEPEGESGNSVELVLQPLVLESGDTCQRQARIKNQMGYQISHQCKKD